MALVQYPDSDSDQELDTQGAPSQLIASAAKGAVKRKHSESAQDDDLPPLPAAFHDLYSTNARASTSDDPSLHGGRKRTIPHVEGKWPSHVYLEWIPSQIESDNLQNLIQHIRDTVKLHNRKSKTSVAPKIIPSLQSELGAPLPLHISLSRTLQIKTEDRDTFLETLRWCLRKAAVRSFRFKFQSLKWVPNFEHNRWFLVIGIERPTCNELNKLLNACNEATGRCGHPALYTGGQGDGPMENNTVVDSSKRIKSEVVEKEGDVDYSDRFHISIAWNLEEPDPELTSLIKTLDVSKHLHEPQAAFKTVKARVGNMVHNIELRTGEADRGTRRGVLGLGHVS